MRSPPLLLLPGHYSRATQTMLRQCRIDGISVERANNNNENIYKLYCDYI